MEAAADSAEAERAEDGKGDIMINTRSIHPFLFFSGAEKARIVSAIQNAEKKTSAEIRVHLERKANQDVFAHARDRFEKLGMTRTKERNGVLIFLGLKSKRFCILGDTGIHSKVSEHFWDDIAAKMAVFFQKNHFSDGIVEAIGLIGEKLAEFFPYQFDDTNELSDHISYSF